MTTTQTNTDTGMPDTAPPPAAVLSVRQALFVEVPRPQRDTAAIRVTAKLLAAGWTPPATDTAEA